MKKSKFTEAQIAFAIKQFETGTRVDEISRQMGISQATFFNWKKKYGSMGVSELRKLRQLKEENQQLKKLVADLRQTNASGCYKKSYKTHVQKGNGIVDGSNYQISKNRACKCVLLCRSMFFLSTIVEMKRL